MPKKHIHPYQTRYHAKAIYSKAIRASGDMVFMQGQVGVDDNGDLVGKGDPGKQADQACRNIQKWMQEAGGELTDVCKLTVYVTDISYRPAVYQAINKWFDGVRHCSTGVVVSSLADEDLLVEIDAIGMID
ncbi:MAG: RidA family protein [Rhodobacteraceae bacterium]|nr:RidA family protein [Paracoccaceae bacterium]MDE2917484.1 RidA family protein [Paracoccaceae bacterium]MYE37035.1 RidA family protein [Paracoccaceae bacterium]MYG42541.1 RidA family protein [Paracoccaceae bacterium]